MILLIANTIAAALCSSQVTGRLGSWVEHASHATNSSRPVLRASQRGGPG
jgi:hypothetical protein